MAFAAAILIGPWYINLVLGLGTALVLNLHAPTRGRIVRAAILLSLAMLCVATLGLRAAYISLPAGEAALLALVLRADSPPSRGDLVLRWVHTPTGRVLTIDRVLAMAGETLAVHSGIASVNGLTVAPLQSLPLSLNFERAIGTNQLAVLPSLVRWRPDGPEPERAVNRAIEQAAVVGNADILGRVILLRRGPWRWTLLP